MPRRFSPAGRDCATFNLAECIAAVGSARHQQKRSRDRFYATWNRCVNWGELSRF